MRTLSSCFRPLVAGAVGLTTIAAFLQPAHAAVVQPTAFPQGVALATTAYTMQFSGTYREATAAAVALDAGLSKNRATGYPFQGSTPNADPASAPLYGPTTCPKTLVLAADDTPADALAASSLFGASALGVTDTAGKPAAFDTRGAALLLTQSGREGATQLDTTTTAAIAKLKSACTGGMDGIVLGGTFAIPESVLDQFKTQLTDVARIAGSDRDDTARSIALAVGGPNGGSLQSVNYFATPTTFNTASGAAALAKTVFLAEDQTGADALSVGAVAARLHVPVLLTPSTELPQATANAMAALGPHNIVVLGGTDAIADSVVTAAKTAAGSGTAAVRIFGPDRYATSVAIAEQLLNLYPAYVSALGANAYSDQIFGLARDEGTAAGGNHVGWPDALASSYYLASLPGGSAPVRSVPSVEKSRTNDGSASTATNITPVACGAGATKCSPYIPLLLTEGAGLAPEVDSYLRAMYPAGGSYKNGANLAGANDGGFAFVFGGSAAVSTATLGQAAMDLSGQTYNAGAASDTAPALTTGSAFFTTLPLAAFTGSAPGSTATFVGSAASANSTADKVCIMPGAVTGVAGVESLNDAGGFSATGPVDYYASSTPFPAGLSLGSCVDLSTASPASTKSTSTFYGVSLSGNATAPAFIDYAAAHRLSFSALGNSPAGTSKDTGSIFQAIPNGSTSETETLEYTGIPLQSASLHGTSFSGATLDLTLNLVRAKGAHSKDVITWTGTFTLNNGSTKVLTAPIISGVADVTPDTGAAINTPFNLLGLDAPPLPGASVPPRGAITMGLNPAVLPGTNPTVTMVAASGTA